MLVCATLVNASGLNASPWDMKRLSEPPKFTEISRDGNLSAFYFDNEPCHGKNTRVFAYCAYPKDQKGKSPGILLLHGGLGRADANWAKLWAGRGYVALAIDLYGAGPEGKPNPDGAQFTDFWDAQVPDSWVYHSVAAAIRGISLLSSMPEVDPKRIAITGISWGGYITCIVAGVDGRLKAAAPVYGCGFIAEDGPFAEIGKLTTEQQARWNKLYDPANYLSKCSAPVLFINGTNDHFFTMPIYEKTAHLVKHRTMCLKVGMQHDHEHGIAPPEIPIFMDQHLRGGNPMPTVKAERRGDRLSIHTPTSMAALHYTTDTGVWEQRKWQSADVPISGGKSEISLPSGRPISYFVSVTDDRGATVTTDCESIAR